MTPPRLRECLATLGISARSLARLTGYPEGAGWLVGRYAVPLDVALWLERAVERHHADPPPVPMARLAEPETVERPLPGL